MLESAFAHDLSCAGVQNALKHSSAQWSLERFSELTFACNVCWEKK